MDKKKALLNERWLHSEWFYSKCVTKRSKWPPSIIQPNGAFLPRLCMAFDIILLDVFAVVLFILEEEISHKNLRVALKPLLSNTPVRNSQVDMNCP